jgi:hypothetical protein
MRLGFRLGKERLDNVDDYIAGLIVRIIFSARFAHVECVINFTGYGAMIMNYSFVGSFCGNGSKQSLSLISLCM